MANPHNLKIGQRLWYVPSNRKKEQAEVVIEKLGHKWFTLVSKHYVRYDVETLGSDTHYGAKDCLHLSREAYEAGIGLSKALDDFKAAVRRLRDADGITLEQINEVRRVLGLEEK